MGNTNKRYTQEFKDSAIQLSLNSEQSTLQIAKDLGISSQTLYTWLKIYREEHNLKTGFSTNHKSSSTKESLEEENRRLRKELASVKKDREILKKAAAYFAKEAH